MSAIDLSLLLPRNDSVVGAGTPPLRVVLLPGEALRVPRGGRTVRVLSGTAWMTRAGVDIVLPCGERSDLRASRDAPVISALGASPLLVEVL